MRTPETLSALVDHGIIERVLRPLMSGKEAQIYLIESGGEQRVAKIYKDAQERTFQNRADYTEGRKVRNSRDQRAMGNRSKHGRAQNEAAWKTAEVDMIYRLRHAGVRVPEPFNFIDGVLIMELVTDADGLPAPRLGDVEFEPEEATQIFHGLLAEVVRMLCAGVVHGDLSDFNVLLSASGPVIIDFPQAVDAASNQNARKLLLRDIDNLQRFHAKFVPGVQPLPYAQEMWDLYQRNALAPETRLTGKFHGSQKAVSTEAVLGLIADADHDERRRREKLGLKSRGAAPQALPEARPGQQARHPQRTELEPRQRPPQRVTPQREPVRGQQGRSHDAPRAARGNAAEQVSPNLRLRTEPRASTWGQRRGSREDGVSTQVREPPRRPEQGASDPTRPHDRPRERAPERPREQAPGRVHERPRERAPERPGERAPERPRERAPERAPERPRERAPERARERVPERARERVPERARERPVEKSGNERPARTPQLDGPLIESDGPRPSDGRRTRR